MFGFDAGVLEYFFCPVSIILVGGHFKMHHPWSLQSAPPWTRFF